MNKMYVYTNKEKSKASFLPSCFALLFFFFFFFPEREFISQSARESGSDFFPRTAASFPLDRPTGSHQTRMSAGNRTTRRRVSEPLGKIMINGGWVGVNGDNAELSALL